jgi:serine/threonine protein kinase
MAERQAEDGPRRPVTPEELIRMEEFIIENDRARFRWVDEREEYTEEELGTGADPSLRNHAKLKPKPNHAHPLEKLTWLGNGCPENNCKVYKSYYAHSDSNYRRPLAVKIFTIDSLSSSGSIKQKLLEEVKIMQPLRHPHVVTYVASYEFLPLNAFDEPLPEEMGIAMYPPGEDFGRTLDAISEQLDNPLVEIIEPKNLDRIKNMFGFFGCLAHTLSVLHHTHVGVKHKDIKPANIIIDHFNQPLFADFGLSKHYQQPGKEWTGGGTKWTYRYAAPEAISRDLVGYPCDVFSLGCVFLEMATVMLGVPLQRMRKHIKQPDYYQAIPGTQLWLSQVLPMEAKPARCGLDDERRDAILQVLPVIQKMMETSPHERYLAENLWRLFRPLYMFTPSGQVCQICNEDDTTATQLWLQRMTELVDESVENEGDAEVSAQKEEDQFVEGKSGSLNGALSHRNGHAKAGSSQTTPSRGQTHITEREPWRRNEFESSEVPSPLSLLPVSVSRHETTNTLSLARNDPSGKHRKILVFGHDELSMRRHKVYIDTTSRFLGTFETLLINMIWCLTINSRP